MGSAVIADYAGNTSLAHFLSFTNKSQKWPLSGAKPQSPAVRTPSVWTSCYHSRIQKKAVELATRRKTAHEKFKAQQLRTVNGLPTHCFLLLLTPQQYKAASGCCREAPATSRDQPVQPAITISGP